MRVEMVLLGTGTSVGVPMVGCRCRVCTSDDPRDKRYRCSALLRHPGGTLVIDTTPEFRLQMLRAGAERLDAVLLTHNHADHIHGLDDVRPFCFARRELLPVYGEAQTLRWVRRHFAYVWEATQQGGGLPRIELKEVDGPFEAAGLPVTPLPVLHGELPAYGYRVGDMAYITDVSRIPEATWPLLERLETLILDATRPAPHATHFHYDAAVKAARRIGARQTYLTHLNHEYLHAELAARCPEGIAPARDGQVVAVEVAP